MDQQNQGDRHRLSWPARALSAAAKAVAVAVLSLGLFTSSPYTNEARAIDLAPHSTVAQLVFSSFILPSNQNVQICARNYNNVQVNVTLVFSVDGKTNTPQTIDVPIEPADTSCADFFPVSEAPVRYRGAIILQSPAECSAATEYPGNCRVVGSLELYDNTTITAVRHLEPVLVPAIHSVPRVSPGPLPQ